MAGVWDGEREVVSLQSRLELSRGWGSGQKKIPSGDRSLLRTAQRMLRRPDTAPKHRRIKTFPEEIFSPCFRTGKVLTGTENTQCIAIPNQGLRPLIILFVQRGWGMPRLLRMFGFLYGGMFYAVLGAVILGQYV